MSKQQTLKLLIYSRGQSFSGSVHLYLLYILKILSLPLWTTHAFYSTSEVGCWEQLEMLLIHVQCVVSNMSEELLLFNDNLNGGVTRCFESRSQNMLDPTFPMMQVFKKKTSNMTQSVLVTSLWHHQGFFSLRMWTLPSVVCRLWKHLFG